MRLRTCTTTRRTRMMSVAERRYDNQRSIETEYLADLEGLNRFIQDRHKAGYARNERMKAFVILGRWYADSIGNVSDVRFLRSDYATMEAPASLPKVVRADRLVDFGIPQIEYSLMYGCVPKAHMVCGECDHGWTLATAHDSHVSVEDVALRVGGAYTGKTLDAVHADLQIRTDGHWNLARQCSLRNDRYIPSGGEVEPIHKANGKGWLRVDRQEHVVEDGDDVLASVQRYTHKACWRLRVHRRYREEFTEIVTRAGWPGVLDETPNLYCKCENCGPWFVATTPLGAVVLGWRKRVIHIDWSATGKDLLGLFQTEDVTKDEHSVHAWGPDKAVEYLTRLRPELIPVGQV